MTTTLLKNPPTVEQAIQGTARANLMREEVNMVMGTILGKKIDAKHHFPTYRRIPVTPDAEHCSPHWYVTLNDQEVIEFIFDSSTNFTWELTDNNKRRFPPIGLQDIRRLRAPLGHIWNWAYNHSSSLKEDAEILYYLANL